MQFGSCMKKLNCVGDAVLRTDLGVSLGLKCVQFVEAVSGASLLVALPLVDWGEKWWLTPRLL